MITVAPVGRRPLLVVGLLVLAGAVGVWGSDLVEHAGPGGGPDSAVRFLIAVVVVLVVCHGCGALLCRVGQPPVLGEIVGGLLLGPSVLGLVWPPVAAWLFPPVVLVHVDRMALVGLILFVFLLGCQRPVRLPGGRVLGVVVAGSTGVPLLAGVGVALATGGLLTGSGGSRMASVLFLGVALAVTALPVLGRLVADQGLEGTRVGAVALAAAAVGDGLAWAGLTVLLAAAGTDNGIPRWSATVGSAVAFVVFVWLCVRPGLAVLDRWLGRREEGTDRFGLAVLVIGAIGCGAATELIGLHPALGAFLFGLAVPRGSAAAQRLGRTLHGVTTMVLLPLFFAGVGLHTAIGLFGTEGAHWLAVAVLVLAAVTSKLAGAGGAARLVGWPAGEAWRLGVLANCRGVTELVLATIGLQHGLISPLGYAGLVLVAVLTTAATGPLLRLPIARSDRNLHRPTTAGGIQP